MRRSSLMLAIVWGMVCSGSWAARNDFVGTKGTHFVRNGRPFYSNGFNAYWLMLEASSPSTRFRVSDIFTQASNYKLNIARTWAFSDGVKGALQTSPGDYDENMFEGLDFVVSEAKRHGIYLILSLVNNYPDFGGKKQYVQWANERGQNLKNDDDFFSNPIAKQLFKNHIKAVLTRVNTITKIAYKDDPTIFAWELMNEPSCQSDLSGRTFQNWAAEMVPYLKSIDGKHLLQIGLEGYYNGVSTPNRKSINPGYEIGTDFISNNRIVGVDFATIHVYPDVWLRGTNESVQTGFANRWIGAHVEDSNTILTMPLLLTEFGKSSRFKGYSFARRDLYYRNIFNSVYNCAKQGGSCGGALFWQLLAEGMDNFRDGYEVVFQQTPSSIDNIIIQASRQISTLN